MGSRSGALCRVDRSALVAHADRRTQKIKRGESLVPRGDYEHRGDQPEDAEYRYLGEL